MLQACICVTVSVNWFGRDVILAETKLAKFVAANYQRPEAETTFSLSLLHNATKPVVNGLEEAMWCCF